MSHKTLVAVFSVVLIYAIWIVGSLVLDRKAEGLRAAARSTAHCGCPAHEKECGVPCVNCCAPNPCRMGENPTSCGGH